MSLFTNIKIGATFSDDVVGTWINNGGGSNATALSDGSDATSVTKDAADPTAYDQYVGRITSATNWPNNEVFRRARFRVRQTRPNSNGSIAIALGRRIVADSFSGGGGVIGPISPDDPGVTLETAAYGADTNYTGTQTTPTTLVGSWLTSITIPTAPSGYYYSLYSVLNGWLVRLKDRRTGPSNFSSFIEVGIDIETTNYPFDPVVASPTGTVTDTPRPTISWTHKDTNVLTVTNRASSGTTRTITTSTAHGLDAGNDVTVALATPNANYDGTYKVVSTPSSTTFTYTATGSVTESVAIGGSVTFGSNFPQAAWSVWVYSAAQYGAAGFAPGSSTPTFYVDGVGSTPSVTPPVSLTSGVTYRAYVQTAKRTNSSSGDLLYSPWAYSQFTMSLTLPTTPSISASYDSANGRVALTISSTANMLTSQDSTFEDDGSGAGTWGRLSTSAYCTLARSTAQANGGAASLLVTPSGASTVEVGAGRNGITEMVAVKPSTSYSVTGTSRAASTVATFSMGFAWYDASGAFISTAYGTGTANTSTGWTTRTHTATSPSNAAYARPMAKWVTTSATGQYLDQVALHAGGTPTYSIGAAPWAYAITRTTSGVVSYVRPPTSPEPGLTLTYYDYEAPRGVSSTYSVTLVGTDAASLPIESAAATSTGVTPTNDSAYWLKAISDPTKNRSAVKVQYGIAEERVESVAVFRPIGRSDAVVVSGDTYGDDMQFEVFAATQAEWESLKPVLMHQGILLLQEPFALASGVAQQRYIRIISRDWQRTGTLARQQYRCRVKAVEVSQGY